MDQDWLDRADLQQDLAPTMHVEQKADLQSNLAAWYHYVDQDWLDRAD